MAIGHAILYAQECISGNFIIANANNFYNPHAIAIMIHFLENSNPNQFCYVGYLLTNTLSPNSLVSRRIIQTDSQNYILSITEIAQIQRESNRSIMILHSTKDFDHSSIL
jgi:hypothetical protein